MLTTLLNARSWLVPYLLDAPRRRRPRDGEEIHVLLAVCDHYEPDWGNPSPALAQRRVDDWVREYPRVLGDFRDADGRPPQHTFFYPLETYNPDHLDGLAELCRGGFGEVEIHLHHDGDDAASLRDRLTAYKELVAARHGLLSRDRDTGDVAYGFIHGNWALDNSRPDGRWCGVRGELRVLRATGCYADFTLPAAPSPCQTRKTNRIYYAAGDPGRCKGHDDGIDAGTRKPRPGSLLLIQGPLLLDWRRRKAGLVPRLENGCLQGSQPPTLARLDLWLRARVQVPQRPDWFFVKLHTHGAPEHNQRVLLGEVASRFHEGLARRAREDRRFHVHYVTAREMANLALAAAAGWQGSVAEARDYRYVSNLTHAGATRELVHAAP